LEFRRVLFRSWVAGRTRSALRPPTTISRLSDSKAAGPVECAGPAALLERTNLVRDSLAVLSRRRLAPAAAAQGLEIPAAGEHDGPKGSGAERMAGRSVGSA